MRIFYLKNHSRNKIFLQVNENLFDIMIRISVDSRDKNMWNVSLLGKFLNINKIDFKLIINDEILIKIKMKSKFGLNWILFFVHNNGTIGRWN